MKIRVPFGKGKFAKPQPQDDTPVYRGTRYYDEPMPRPGTRGTALTFDAPAARTVMHGSADDDGSHRVPRWPFLRGHSGDGSYAQGESIGYVSLMGPHFRIGYQGYVGIQPFDTVDASEADARIGQTWMRPPLITNRRGTSPLGVRDAVVFQMSQPNSWPVITPQPVRR